MCAKAPDVGERCGPAPRRGSACDWSQEKEPWEGRDVLTARQRLSIQVCACPLMALDCPPPHHGFCYGFGEPST